MAKGKKSTPAKQELRKASRARGVVRKQERVKAQDGRAAANVAAGVKPWDLVKAERLRRRAKAREEAA